VQAWFEAHELGGVVVDHVTQTQKAARRSPYHVLPRGYFQSRARDDTGKSWRDDGLAALSGGKAGASTDHDF
jgi:hypothetical protein